MKERSSKRLYIDGLKDGLPICLVYFIVSFTFGITVVNYGMPWWYATLISATNLTSAGQFAGVNLIVESANYAVIALTVLFINLRYFLMSVSISQQLDMKLSVFKRFIMGLFVTDEIFALASVKGNKLRFVYFMGLSTLPYFGWALGTLTGSLINSVLPESLQAAMGIALYCMFIALVIPPAKKSKPVAITAGIALILSCLFYYTPYINTISMGFKIIISTILAATITAILYPVHMSEYQNEEYVSELEEGMK